MEIFLKHQPIHSKKILRAMFDKLAHASIMKLNTESMDRVRNIYFIHVKNSTVNLYLQIYIKHKYFNFSCTT